MKTQNLMKAAAVAVIVVVTVICGACFAHADYVMPVQASNLYEPSDLLLGESDGSSGISLQHQSGMDAFGITLRGAIRASIFASSNNNVLRTPPSLPPAINYDELVSITHRDVSYLPDVPEFQQGENAENGVIISAETGEMICGIYVERDEFGDVVKTTLRYFIGEIVVIKGPVNLASLIATAEIAEGVYYGVPTVVTKAYNEYDNNGNSTFSIMKSTYFDEGGRLTAEEVTKERSYYDANGNLISNMSYFTVNGKVSWVKSVSKIYQGDFLYMEIKSEIHYNDNGTVSSSLSDSTTYSANGAMTRTLNDYTAGRLTHSLKTAEEVLAGLATTTNDEKWYYDNGTVSLARLTYKYVGDNGNGSQSVQTYYNYDGTINSVYRVIDEEQCSNGLVMHRRHYDSGSSVVDGNLVPSYENEMITDFEYDDAGALIKERTYGHSGTLLIDNVTTYLYQNGVLVSKHVIKSQGYDNGPKNIYEEYVVYQNGLIATRYETAYENDQLTMVTTEIYDRYEDGTIAARILHTDRYSNGEYSGSTDELEMHNRNGDITFRSVRETGVNGVVSSYTEEREYYSDGKLKSVNIVSDNGYRYRLNDDAFEIPGHYELHETYSEAGLITHREESNYQNGVKGEWERIWGWGWGDEYSSNVTEDWQYNQNGSLVNYKKTFTSNSWNSMQSETVEKIYDPTTGKILEEKYSSTSTRPDRLICDGVSIYKMSAPPDDLIGYYRDQGVPKDVANFLGNVVLAFEQSIANWVRMGDTGGRHQGLDIVYHYNESGQLESVDVNWTSRTEGGDNEDAFFCKLYVDANGKIKSIEASGDPLKTKLVFDGTGFEYITDIPYPNPRIIVYEETQVMDVKNMQQAERTLPNGVALTGKLAGQQTGNDMVQKK